MKNEDGSVELKEFDETAADEDEKPQESKKKKAKPDPKEGLF